MKLWIKICVASLLFVSAQSVVLGLADGMNLINYFLPESSGSSYMSVQNPGTRDLFVFTTHAVLKLSSDEFDALVLPSYYETTEKISENNERIIEWIRFDDTIITAKLNTEDSTVIITYPNKSEAIAKLNENKSITITFPDDTTITYRFLDDGDFIVRTPDGSMMETEFYSNDILTANSFDGTVVNVSPDGTITTTLSDGTTFTTNPDGTVVNVSALNPSTTMSAEGIITNVSPDDTITNVSPDGTITTTLSDGTTFTTTVVGTVTTTLSDGTTFTTNPDGTVVNVSPDGTITTTLSDGTTFTTAVVGTVTTTLSDGTTFTTAADGTITTTLSDGTTFTTNPDGTVVNVSALNPSTTMSAEGIITNVSPDGTITTTLSDGTTFTTAVVGTVTTTLSEENLGTLIDGTITTTLSDGTKFTTATDGTTTTITPDGTITTTLTDGTITTTLVNGNSITTDSLGETNVNLSEGQIITNLSNGNIVTETNYHDSVRQTKITVSAAETFQKSEIVSSRITSTESITILSDGSVLVGDNNGTVALEFPDGMTSKLTYDNGDFVASPDITITTKNFEGKTITRSIADTTITRNLGVDGIVTVNTSDNTTITNYPDGTTVVRTMNPDGTTTITTYDSEGNVVTIEIIPTPTKPTPIPDWNDDPPGPPDSGDPLLFSLTDKSVNTIRNWPEQHKSFLTEFDLYDTGEKVTLSRTLDEGTMTLFLDLNGDGMLTDGTEWLYDQHENVYQILSREMIDSNQNGYFDWTDNLWNIAMVKDGTQYSSANDLGIVAINWSNNMNAHGDMHGEHRQYANCLYEGVYLYPNCIAVSDAHFAITAYNENGIILSGGQIIPTYGAVVGHLDMDE